MNIAIIGFGAVGKALVQLIREKKGEFLLLGLDINVKYIINSKGGIYSNKGIVIEELDLNSIEVHNHWNIGLNYGHIIRNKDVDLLVELTSTNIIDGEPGITHIKECIKAGIHVVTGNKGPILFSYRELKALAESNGVQLGIGCTTGGALSSINVGLFDCAGANISSIEGVLNGTTNFILKTMEEEGLDYSRALKRAQELGIAEKSSQLDVKGIDTAIKIIILGNVLMGSNLTLESINIKGIEELTFKDLMKAKDKGKKLKLLGKVEKISDDEFEASVAPKEVDKGHPLYAVEGKNKGVYFKTDTLGDITVMGGASSPKNAAAAILRDIINIHKGYKFI